MLSFGSYWVKQRDKLKLMDFTMLIKDLSEGIVSILSQFADDTELGRVPDTPSG